MPATQSFDATWAWPATEAFFGAVELRLLSSRLAQRECALLKFAQVLSALKQPLLALDSFDQAVMRCFSGIVAGCSIACHALLSIQAAQTEPQNGMACAVCL